MHNELESFGYGFFQEQYRSENNIEIENVARVISDSREIYLLQTRHGVCRGTITGKMRYNAGSREDLPAIGDWVSVSRADAQSMVIETLFPRRSHLSRSAVGKADVQIIAANIDAVFIVVAVDRDFSLNRIDRYLSLIMQGGALPTVVLNKCDLTTEEYWGRHEADLFRRHPAVGVIATSLVSGQGLDQLAQTMRAGQTCCFVGSSGVGKSSLINHLAGKEIFATAKISDANGRGRHTTTSRHLHLLPSGTLLLDTPGMREVAMSDAESGVGEAFAEVEQLASNCRFKDCGHENEPGCAVRSAIEDGRLDVATLANYRKLRRESVRFEQKIQDRRKAEKSFGKMAREVFKIKKQLKGY